MSGVEVICAVCLDGVPHGFLGRRGGVSTGELAGLNVGYGS
ncbi:MAG TPA: polyphenol oxidase, partial [Sphingomicrobium sp.]|nr:polyphenol oxidase [Sphingomicrobium sp.]